VTERSGPRRDRLPIVISLFSLLISALTIYFNVLLELDDIRVVIGQPPTISREKNGEVSIDGDQEFTFVNSGNRTAAVTYVFITTERIETNVSQAQSCGNMNDKLMLPLPFDVAALVLKAGEINIVSARLGAKRDKQGIIRIPKELFSAAVGDQILVCLAVNIVTPDNYSTQQRIPVYKFTFENEFAEESALFDKNKPLSLRHARHFFDW
jgi:hypothetical protein